MDTNCHESAIDESPVQIVLASTGTCGRIEKKLHTISLVDEI